MAERQKIDRKKEYSFEIVDRCEGLYVNEDRTFEEISGRTKVPAVTLQRWGEKYEWKKKKEEFRARLLKAQEETRALIREEILLQDLVHQRDLMKKYFEGKEVMEKADTQMMYAYTNVTDAICKILADMRKRDESLRGIQKIDRPQMFIDFLKDLVSYLKEHDPEALAGLEKNFDPFIQFAKGKYS